MPAAAWAVPAVAGLAGQALSARTQNTAARRASQAQLGASQEAANLERERLAEERRQFDEQNALEQRRHEERRARIQAILARYGRGGGGASMGLTQPMGGGLGVTRGGY